MQGLKEAMNRLELQKIEAMGPHHWQDAVKEEDIDKNEKVREISANSKNMDRTLTIGNKFLLQEQ